MTATDLSQHVTDPAQARPRVLFLVGLFVLIFAVHFWRLGSPPLAGTEGHRAVTAHQMLEADRFERWVVPHLFDRPYLRKPPLQYWILAAAESVGGAGTWTWRVPSAGASALTGVVVAWFATLWFGRGAGWVAGLGFLSIVALWSQSRSADIDANNTLMSTLAACVIVHLHTHRARAFAWVLAGGIAFGAALLLKGPATLPIVLGALLGPLLINRSFRPALGVVLLVGAALFAGYALLARQTVVAFGIVPDTSGVSEGLQNLMPRSAGRLLEALAVPPQLFAFSLPVSVGLILAFHPLVRDLFRRDVPDDADRRRATIVRALAGSVLVGWGVCLMSGMVNPRYGYVTLPLLAPLAGGVVRLFMFTGETASRDKAARFFGVVLTCTAVGLGAAGLVLGGLSWSTDEQRVLLVVSTALSLVTVVYAIHLLKRHNLRRGALATGVVLVLLAVPFGAYENDRRSARSGLQTAWVLRDTVGAGTRVTTGRLMAYQPELFYYAQVQVDSIGDAVLEPQALIPGRWLVLDGREFDALNRSIPDRLHLVVQTTSNKKPVVMAWFE